MPRTTGPYSAEEDLHFCGNKYVVTVEFGLVHVRLDGKDCLWGRLTEHLGVDGVDWTDEFCHPGVKDAAFRTVQEMLRWSREQRACEDHKRKYGYYPGEFVG